MKRRTPSPAGIRARTRCTIVPSKGVDIGRRSGILQGESSVRPAPPGGYRVATTLFAPQGEMPMLHLTRRRFLVTVGAGAAALLAPRPVLAQPKGPFTLPPLPYPYDALKKAIDEE